MKHGEIKVSGTAKKRIPADKMSIEITIQAAEKTSARALENVKKYCEQFLETLGSKNMDISQIRLENDSVEEYRNYSSGEVDMIAKRKIEVDMDADIKVANAILYLVEKSHSDMQVKFTYYLSDLEDVHKQLLKEAILDSKKQAEIMAAAIGEKIIGVKEIKNQELSYRHFKEHEVAFAPAGLDEINKETPFADSLGLPLKEEREIIDVIWYLEKDESDE